MPYLIDTNVLIHSQELPLRLRFLPAFWNWLVEQHALGSVLSVTRVRDEIRQGNDDLSEWVAALPDGFFLEPTEESRCILRRSASGFQSQGVIRRRRRPCCERRRLLSRGAGSSSGSLSGDLRGVSKTKGKDSNPGSMRGVGVECLPPHECYGASGRGLSWERAHEDDQRIRLRDGDREGIARSGYKPVPAGSLTVRTPSSPWRCWRSSARLSLRSGGS